MSFKGIQWKHHIQKLIDESNEMFPSHWCALPRDYWELTKIRKMNNFDVCDPMPNDRRLRKKVKGGKPNM